MAATVAHNLAHGALVGESSSPCHAHGFFPLFIHDQLMHCGKFGRFSVPKLRNNQLFILPACLSVDLLDEVDVGASVGAGAAADVAAEVLGGAEVDAA